MARVLLIDPPTPYDDQMNLGPVSIASYLESLGHDVRVVDMNFRKQDAWRRLYAVIAALEPQLIGISVMTYFAFGEVKELLRELVGYSSPTGERARVVVGGASPSLQAERMLRENPEIDFAVVGEGEQTTNELANALTLNRHEFYDVKGLTWRRDDGSVVVNEPRSLIEPLDSLPPLDFDLIDLVHEYGFKYYRDTLTLCTSRGCPSNCIFCLSSVLCHRRWRALSAKRVVDEIENGYRKYGLTRVSFQDDNFVMKPQRVIEMCQLIKERGLPVRLCLEGGIRADRVTSESLAALKSVGLERGFLGVESGSPKVFEKINKGESLESIEKTLVALKDTGMDLQIYMILGLPYETHETHMESVAFAKKHGVKCRWHFAFPFESTKLYDYVKEHGRFLRDCTSYDIDISNRITSPGTVPLAFDTPEYPTKQRVRDYYRAVFDSETFFYISGAKSKNRVIDVLWNMGLVLKYRPSKIFAYLRTVAGWAKAYFRLRQE